MKNNQYLITLTPAGNYFFGNDKGFGDKTDNNNVTINYLVSGLKYPQQTTLLGFLRYELLRNAGLLDRKQTEQEVKDLIGETGGFDGTDKEYGAIKSLSPVFLKLQHGDSTSFILPTGKVFQDGNEKVIMLDEHVLKGNNAILNGYDQKKYLTDISEQIINPESEKVSVFGESQQIGIKKNYSGQTEEDAFFKQTFSRLKKNHAKQRYSFAFYAEFTREIEPGKLKSEMVFMGGDQSLFRLDYKRLDEEPVIENQFDKIVEQNNRFIDNANESDIFKVVLLSDCKLDKSAFGKALACINEIVDFRHIITKTETTRFAHMSSHKTDLNKSDKHDLTARGSVFYVKGTHLNEFCEEFKKYPAYITIGYNYYQISK